MHTYIHTYIHTYLLTYLLTYIHTYIHNTYNILVKIVIIFITNIYFDIIHTGQNSHNLILVYTGL